MMRKIIGSNIALHTELFFFQTYSAEYGILAVENTFELVACSGADAGGNWQPTLQLRSDRQVSLINTAQGIAGNRFFRIEMTDGMRLRTVGSSEAILKADNITTSNKTFQFPNASRTFALLENPQTFTGTKTFSNATYSALFTGGNVGIGTTTPAAIFHVWRTASSTIQVGDSTKTGCLVVGDSDGSGVTYVTFNDGVMTATTTKPAICQEENRGS